MLLLYELRLTAQEVIQRGVQGGGLEVVVEQRAEGKLEVAHHFTLLNIYR